MTRSRAQYSRLVASTLLACRVLVIALGLLDLVSTVLNLGFLPEVIAIAALGFAAIIAATRHAGLGVALAVVPIAAGPLFPGAAFALLPMLATVASATVSWRVRHVVPLVLAYATVIGVDAALMGAPARIAMYVGNLLLGLAVGWGLRALLLRSREGAQRIASLEKRVAEVRRDERASLADELSSLLVDDLEASRTSLHRSLPEGDLAALTRALDEVEERARTSLARLRQLVSTLRSPGQDEPDSPRDLVTAIEEVEDVLVGHGHQVALDLAGIPPLVAAGPAALLVECLRAAADHARVHAPAGAPCLIRVACSPESLDLRVEHALGSAGPTTPTTELRQATERVRARGGMVVMGTEGTWSLTAEIPLRAEQRATRTPSRRPRLTWAPEGLGRLVLTLPAVVALAREVTLTLSGAMRGATDWPDGVLWSLLWLGLALASWSTHGAVLVLTGGLAYGLTVWSGTAAGLIQVPQVLLAGALTGVLVARWPRWLAACLVGWAAYLPLWTRTGMDFATLIAAFAVACLGGLTGLTIHHFVAARASQLAELERLGTEHTEARAQERRQLASELHDIVAHQLSLVGLQVMAQRGASDANGLRSTVEQVAAITKSARADLTTLVTVMRAHHEGTATDRPEAGQATWLTPSHAAEGVAATLHGAGHPVQATASGGLDGCDPTLSRTVSRILREATTNILRYAPPGSPCAIEVTDRDDVLEVTVASTLPDTPLSSPLSTGFGLLGLQERVSLTGGTFSAGPRGARWVVRARLPRGAARARAPRSPAQRGERVGVDDAELDGAHQHLRPRPHPELVGHPRQILRH